MNTGLRHTVLSEPPNLMLPAISNADRHINYLIEIGLKCVFIWMGSPLAAFGFWVFGWHSEWLAILLIFVRLILPISLIAIAWRGIKFVSLLPEYRQEILPFRTLLLTGVILFSFQVCSLTFPVFLLD